MIGRKWSAATGSSRQLDLVTLASSYADAMSAVETAKAHWDETGQLSKKEVVGKSEVTIARLALQSAERKAQLLTRIVEAPWPTQTRAVPDDKGV